MEKEQWYSNKDLFEKIQKLSDELQETRQLVIKYNGLVEKLYRVEEKTEENTREVKNLADEVSKMEYTIKGRSSAFEKVRNWTPWLITIASVLHAFVSNSN